jgi:D-alanyl-D-alanine carboxypeptidase/D-alanyl-D-alanine-endopeptidase (penicillin-binding protein 4)
MFNLYFLFRKTLLAAGSGLLVVSSFGQPINQRLSKAFQQFGEDSQLKHAISSLYVIDANTGSVVFDKNSQVGLAPASTQKIITSVTAFELLGKDYRYKTIFTGDSRYLYVAGSGDPTLGSWRYKNTRDTNFFSDVISGLQKAGIKNYRQLIIYDDPMDKIPPSGWIVEDIGNYYGAGAHGFNWYENQYEVTFIPGKKTGDPAEIDTASTFEWWNILNECKTGPPGSGDNAYIYFIPGSFFLAVKGTVPAGVNRFSISGADPSPYKRFALSFIRYGASRNFYSGDLTKTPTAPWKRPDSSLIKNALYIHYSPALDSIIYWFNKKSINLYGEALVKTFAYEKQGFGNTDSGVAIVRRFWKDKGIDENELNIYDGSGLSPLNRVTTHAQVEILNYARTKDWYPYFYDALPEYNDMKMKSGTISDVKGFCGYHKAKDGKEYIFSFLVNNYNGRTSMVVNKMYKVLDILK